MRVRIKTESTAVLTTEEDPRTEEEVRKANG